MAPLVSFGAFIILTIQGLFFRALQGLYLVVREKQAVRFGYENGLEFSHLVREALGVLSLSIEFSGSDAFGSRGRHVS